MNVVALKQGNAERSCEQELHRGDPAHVDHDTTRGSDDFGKRASRWYLLETSRRDRIVIEEDLRESRYVFEVPSQVCMLVPVRVGVELECV